MTNQIEIKGPIVPDNYGSFYEYFDMPYASPAKVNESLQTGTDDVELIINSNGGDVNAASEIWTSLKDYSGKVTAKIYGMAASAASLIAMSADETQMSPTATLMIHCAGADLSGNENDHTKIASVLQSTDHAIADIYANKAGKSTEEMLDLMKDETFFNAEEAKEAGLVDTIMFDTNETPILVNSLAGMMPHNVIDEFNNKVLHQSNDHLITAKSISPIVSDEVIDKIVNKLSNCLNKTNLKNNESDQTSNDPFAF